jgi:hypothetical protein
MNDKVYLAKKGGAVVYHTDKKAMLDIEGITPEMDVSIAEWEEAGGLARIINGEIVLGKTDVEKAVENETAALGKEYEALQTELASKDYKVVKAAEAGLVLANAEPELHERREWCRSRINEIRVRLSELKDGEI